MRDWGGRGVGLGAAEDGLGGEAEQVWADGASQARRVDCAVAATAVYGWLSRSGCDERE